MYLSAQLKDVEEYCAEASSAFACSASKVDPSKRMRDFGIHPAPNGPVWEKAAELGTVPSLHTHYGVGAAATDPDGLWGFAENGHVLPLAIAFPFKTAAATARLILSGTFDHHTKLKILLVHSGGALPILSSRLASCVVHYRHVWDRLKHDPSYYLGLLCYDCGIWSRGA
ncbi:hypothetical protein BJ742DRAFT_742392 [Cladochytrium replicatum]|nr:hypothetical protein BJ742DRAFT_742392 [Cladochytrium replicatum]